MAQRTDFGSMECSIARTIDIFGEPWTPLVLRDIWVGMNRFDVIQKDLGISPKVLTQRLKWLGEHDVIESRQYSDRPPRFEYCLTTKGLELCDILMAMTAWGDRWTAGATGPPVLIRHRACGELTHAEIRCAHCGQPLHADEVDLEPGLRP
jgi:DNA-binding HxlR family transcriptional regulator